MYRLLTFDENIWYYVDIPVKCMLNFLTKFNIVFTNIINGSPNYSY